MVPGPFRTRVITEGVASPGEPVVVAAHRDQIFVRFISGSARPCERGEPAWVSRARRLESTSCSDHRRISVRPGTRVVTPTRAMRAPVTRTMAGAPLWCSVRRTRSTPRRGPTARNRTDRSDTQPAAATRPASPAPGRARPRSPAAVHLLDTNSVIRWLGRLETGNTANGHHMCASASVGELGLHLVW